MGGPYTVMAEAPDASGDTAIVGANAGTASVAAFTDVLFESKNAQILPPGRERTIAEEAVSGPHEKAFNLYDWTGGALRLVNVEGEGSNVTKLNACGGGSLGAGVSTTGPGAVGAVSRGRLEDLLHELWPLVHAAGWQGNGGSLETRSTSR